MDQVCVSLGVVVALLLLFILALAYRRGRRDGFVSERARAVHGKVAPMFAGGRDPGFSEYKRAVPDGEAVEYAALRKQARKGGITAAGVQHAMDY